MKLQYRTAGKAMCVAALSLFMASCQKMDRPELGDYTKDTNPPGGPLKFYAAFDGTSSDPLLNAVDSIRANFPSDNPFTSVPGVSGKAVQGAAKKFIKYPSFNEWAQSSSITISTWIKKNGQTNNNTGGNGPEYVFSLRSSADDKYHWSNGVMAVFFEGNNTACAIKVFCVSNDPANAGKSVDGWFTWEGGQSIPGILDNNWHHIALTYDETNSTMRLYVDGVLNPNAKTWNNHGALKLATDKIAEYRVGRGPRNDDDADGEGGWLQSSLKGSIDQLRLYSKALSAAEITTLFNSKM